MPRLSCLLLCSGVACAFQVSPWTSFLRTCNGNRPPILGLSSDGASCGSAAWPALQAELDVLPVFVLANKAGEPLQQVDQRTNQPTLAVFADLFRAEAELANANRLYPDLGLGLLPIGLGDAFARAQAGGAQLIASQNELSAGLDPKADTTVVPLFGCTKLMKPRKSDQSKQAMPLFMSYVDAKAALDRALSGFAVPEGMQAEQVGLDVLCIPLATAIDLIVTGEETRFEFYAPTKSVEWMEQFAQQRTEQASASPDGPPVSVQSEEQKAMFEQLLDQRQGVLGGLFPDDMDKGIDNSNSR